MASDEGSGVTEGNLELGTESLDLRTLPYTHFVEADRLVERAIKLRTEAHLFRDRASALDDTAEKLEITANSFQALAETDREFVQAELDAILNYHAVDLDRFLASSENKEYFNVLSTQVQEGKAFVHEVVEFGERLLRFRDGEAGVESAETIREVTEAQVTLQRGRAASGPITSCTSGEGPSMVNTATIGATPGMEGSCFQLPLNVGAVSEMSSLIELSTSAPPLPPFELSTPQEGESSVRGGAAVTYAHLSLPQLLAFPELERDQPCDPGNAGEPFTFSLKETTSSTSPQDSGKEKKKKSVSKSVSTTNKLHRKQAKRVNLKGIGPLLGDVKGDKIYHGAASPFPNNIDEMVLRKPNNTIHSSKAKPDQRVLLEETDTYSHAWDTQSSREWGRPKNAKSLSGSLRARKRKRRLSKVLSEMKTSGQPAGSSSQARGSRPNSTLYRNKELQVSGNLSLGLAKGRPENIIRTVDLVEPERPSKILSKKRKKLRKKD